MCALGSTTRFHVLETREPLSLFLRLYGRAHMYMHCECEVWGCVRQSYT